MVREVDLISYLPPFLTGYKETNITLTAENPEFTLVWKAADQTLKNEFIATSDEYGISRFEKLLNIVPSHNDTLENRRERIQFRWFTMLPYTWRMLIQKLIALCGESDFTITKQFDFYRINLDVHLELSGQVEELERIIETMLPCNMVTDARNSIFINAECAARAFCNAYLAHCYMITNDWHENIHVKGFSLNGAAVSNTASVVIMETFKEQLTVNGNGSAGFGIATTECIEIY